MIHNRPEGQTVVVIAHRLSTLRAADQIVFVESDGTVNESGSWDELCARKGKFHEFVQIQALSAESGPTSVTSTSSGGVNMSRSPSAASQSSSGADGDSAGDDGADDTYDVDVDNDAPVAHSVPSPSWKKVRSMIHAVAALNDVAGE
jgi:hypothetical protein